MRGRPAGAGTTFGETKRGDELRRRRGDVALRNPRPAERLDKRFTFTFWAAIASCAKLPSLFTTTTIRAESASAETVPLPVAEIVRPEC